jgi:hypothetical protein
MAREPRDEDAYEDLGGGEGGPREPRPIKETPPLQLVTDDEVDEDLASMCRIWGVYVTAGVLGQYRGVLKGLTNGAIHEAVMQWLRAPLEDRAARPHELRTFAEAHDRLPPAPVHTISPQVHPLGEKPSRDLDHIFAELAQENPHVPMYAWIIERRVKAAAAGQPLDEQQTLDLFGRQVLDAHPMPEGRADEEEAR